MKIMFANTISVHLTVYRKNLRQLETVLGIIVPGYAKSEECFATFDYIFNVYLKVIN